MKILAVHNFYKIPGGEDTVFNNECSLLENHGHRVIKYIRRNSEMDRSGLSGKLALPFTMVFSLRTYREIRHIIRKERPDIVHVHNSLHLISPAVYYAAAAEGVPVVQTLHNFRLQCPAGIFYRDGHICRDCVKGGFRCALAHSCYRGSFMQTFAMSLMLTIHRATGIYKKINYISLTEFNKELLLKSDIVRPGRVYIKPNFTPFRPAAGSGDEGYYLAVGRLEHIKGTALMVRAFAKSGRRLVLAGSGEYLEKLERTIVKHNLKNIELCGQVDPDTVARLMCGAKALLAMPQWYETFGMTVIEAFSMHLPVICNDIGNIKDLFSDGRTGLICKNTAESLNSAVERFETMDRQRMGDRAYSEYIKKYSPAVNYAKLMEIYMDVLKHR